MSNIRIEMTGHGRGKVFVDEVELVGVRAVDFFAAIDRTNQVTVTLSPETVEVTDLNCEVRTYVDLRMPTSATEVSL